MCDRSSVQFNPLGSLVPYAGPFEPKKRGNEEMGDSILCRAQGLDS